MALDLVDANTQRRLALLEATSASLAATYATRPTAWTGLAYTNSWVDFNAAYLGQYRKEGDRVWLRGLIKSGVAGAAFTLPAGFRPVQTDETFPVIISPGTVLGVVSINGSTGVATVSGAGSTTFTYLSGISFSTVA